MGVQMVQLLGSTCYNTFMSPISDDESGVEFVHIANIHEPGAGFYQAYLKLYQPPSLYKGLFNEIAGFLFAEALKLPQPEKAWVIKVPLNLIPDQHLPDWLKDYRDNVGDEYPAFATSRVNGPCAALEITNAAACDPMVYEKIVSDVRKWSHLPNVVGLDNTISNVDRHLNNLLRTGKHQYSLIDNGRLVHDEGLWEAAALVAGKNYENKLCTYVWARSPTQDEFEKAALGAREHKFGFAEIAGELKYWGDLLLEEADRDAFIAFLEERAKAAEAILAARYTSAA